MNTTTCQVSIAVNGPYLVKGGLPLKHQHIVANPQGDSLSWREGAAVATPSSGTYALCRCGQSASKPFCDGAHQRVGFDGTETARREPYEVQAEHIEGPILVLDDAKALCAFARFCDVKGKVWNLVLQGDPESAALVNQQASDCPGGRLRARQRAQAVAPAAQENLEPHFDLSIGLVQDTAKAVSGPLWLRGGVALVSADGSTYEVRNRVALCRCGASGNKPFCDGSHVSSAFTDAA